MFDPRLFWVGLFAPISARSRRRCLSRLSKAVLIRLAISDAISGDSRGYLSRRVPDPSPPYASSAIIPAYRGISSVTSLGGVDSIRRLPG